jgi:hypothetical protein
LRVKGLKVDVEEVETLRVERLGLNAVRRRRMGVKDWKRFWRWGEDIVGDGLMSLCLCLVVVCWMK